MDRLAEVEDLYGTIGFVVVTLFWIDLLAVTVVLAALAHVELVGHYVAGTWRQLLWVRLTEHPARCRRVRRHPTGGIGVTPVMSMLRAGGPERPRRMTLIYANNTIDEVSFLDELAELSSRLDLHVVHALAEPPPE